LSEELIVIHKKDFEKQVEIAARRVKAMDQADGQPDRDIGTIIAAFQAGLGMESDIANECLFDAFYMLRDLRDGLFDGRYKVADFVRTVLPKHQVDVLDCSHN
jgi:hypothetical protein